MVIGSLFLNWELLPSRPLPTTPLPAFIPGVNLTATPPPPDTVTAFPDPSDYRWSLAAQGFELPVGIANAADSSNRLFILERRGVIKILQDGRITPKPFLNIEDRAGSAVSEQGLLGLAFHPRYEENGYFWVNYTDKSGRTIISRFQVSADSNIADPGTETRYLVLPQPYANHNGGDLAFGPDGYLYLALGDGGSAGDPHKNGQNTGALLGKLLRLDVDRQPGAYTIPADNPFSGGGGAPEVWAYGLRNPWRIAFDALTGDLYIADVGQNTWEEVNFLAAGSPGGANFGWNFREGRHNFLDTVPQQFASLDPVAEYQHGENGCSVTGGKVYRGGALPAWRGIYLFSDFCSGKIWGLLRDAQGSWQTQELFDLEAQVVSFGTDENGEIYLAGYSGEIYRLEPQHSGN